MGEFETNKKCVHCGIDIQNDALPSKFDKNFCEFCQDQDTGSFETSTYAKVFEFAKQAFFMDMQLMSEKEAKVNAEKLIKYNPSTMLRCPCTR